MQIRRLFLVAAVAALAIPATAPAVDAQMLQASDVTALEYREIGPTRQSGRFVEFTVPMQQPYTFYAATATGGLWKTENNGLTYEILFTDEAVHSIGAIEVAPSDPNILYLGSGEANNSRSSYWGDGVYKSTDAGQTWTNVGLPMSGHIGRIIVHPTDPNTAWVAALGHLYSENPERGMYKTTDGGRSWQQTLAPVVEGKTIGAVDVAIDPTNPNVLYAATFDKVRVPWSYDLAGPGSRVYKSTDGGDSWEMLTNGLPMGMLGRIGVAVSASNPNTVYLTIENANKEGMSDAERLEELRTHQSSNGMIGGEIYRSDDAGNSWRKTNADDQPIGGGPAYYYGQIRVDPNDPDRVYVMSVSTMLSEDGGRTWDTRALGFGGDDHALWINPNDSNHMLLGYDHGLGVTFDGGENWYHPDNQSLAQFYAIGLDNSYPYRIAGGLQDNGSHMAYHTNPAGGPINYEDWSRVGGGDGMYNEFDHCTGRYLYNESQFGPISRRDLWTGESEGIRISDSDMRWNWNAPILVSPHDCDVIFHAGNRVVRSDNRGETWEHVSPDLTKADPMTLATGRGGDGNIQYATITSFDQSELDAGILWAGTDDGNVQVTRNGGDTWTLVSGNMPNNPEYWVSRVEASHHVPGRAYVSMTGMRRDDFGAYVYMTNDFGATWTDISNNLPEQPINVVREHHSNPGLLFVGTDMQVFTSIDMGRNWVSMKNNMPTNPVHDIKIHARENDLVVATHGRGVFITDISGLAQVTPDVMAQDIVFMQPESKVRWIASDNMNTASDGFNGESERMAVPLYYYLNGAANEVKFVVYQGQVAISEITGEADSGMNMVYWGMDRREERSQAQQDQMRERMARFGQAVDEDQIRFTSSPAPIGSYTIAMVVDGVEVGRHRASILRDEWWMNRR